MELFLELLDKRNGLGLVVRIALVNIIMENDTGFTLHQLHCSSKLIRFAQLSFADYTSFRELRRYDQEWILHLGASAGSAQVSFPQVLSVRLTVR